MKAGPDQASPEERGPGEGREWHRALALGLFLVSASVAGPFALVAAPFLLMVLGLPVRRRGGLLLAAVVAVFLLAGPADEGMWYVERGWALLAGGWFVALTLAWPGARLGHRALGAVGGAAGVAGVAFAVKPAWWWVLDWQVQERMVGGVTQALDLLREFQGGDAISGEVEASVLRTAEIQAALFPALLGLTTLAGLALAWWLYNRVAAGRRGGLGSLKEFRFEDQLVWVFIGGLLLVVVTAGEGWTRAGSNTLVFMGALYALRGAAVVLFLNGGLSVLGGVLVALGMLFMAPVILVAAMLIGLSDTWLDVRTKVRALVS